MGSAKRLAQNTSEERKERAGHVLVNADQHSAMKLSDIDSEVSRGGLRPSDEIG